MVQPMAKAAGLAQELRGEDVAKSPPSTLVNRNVFIGRRRTSVRLEPAMWDALAEICRREQMTVHDLCGLIDERRRASSLTAAIRVFIVTYFRVAATEDGHANVGHGTLYRRQKRARGGDARLGPDSPGTPAGA